MSHRGQLSVHKKGSTEFGFDSFKAPSEPKWGGGRGREEGREEGREGGKEVSNPQREFVESIT